MGTKKKTNAAPPDPEPTTSLRVSCPECGAPAGEQCRSGFGAGVVVSMHRARIDTVDRDLGGTDPLEVIHRRRGQPPIHHGRGGVVEIQIPRAGLDPLRFEIEAYQRSGYPDGLMIRSLDSSIDIQPEASNAILVKPRF